MLTGGMRVVHITYVEVQMRPAPSAPTRRVGRTLAACALIGASGALAACSSGDDSGKPELIWYINPDLGGQEKVAENCSTDDYTVSVEVLPQDASQQRIQLVRRLAAEDPAIDLMSIDPPYTAEFAEAGFLEEIPQDQQDLMREQSFTSAVDAATWKDQLVVLPFWSNTQVLWYRKSFVEKAGIDMQQPQTWSSLIETAEDNNGTVAVQANKYEGYVVWINALVESAGGSLIEEAEKGADAEVTVGEEPGSKAAEVIEDLAASEAAPSDLSVSNEGTAGTTFGGDEGAFMVNWTYIWNNYDEAQPEVAKDIGYAPYPQVEEGQESAPPYGGIGIGVSKYSDHTEEALAAAACIVEPENQGINAELTGNMPASAEGYDYPPLKKQYTEDLLQLFQDSLQRAAPRAVTPYWGDISLSLQNTWHPASGVDPETAESSAEFIDDVLKGGRLL